MIDEKTLKRRRYQALYRRKNPEKTREMAMRCHKRFKTYFNYIYHKIKERCTKGKPLYRGLPYMDSKTWQLFLIDTKPERETLHKAWVESGYLRRLCPSVDRIDSSVGYIPSNCRWMTLSDNSLRGNLTRRTKDLTTGRFVKGIER